MSRRQRRTAGLHEQRQVVSKRNRKLGNWLCEAWCLWCLFKRERILTVDSQYHKQRGGGHQPDLILRNS